MSLIADLIAEFAPDGVPYRTVENLFDVVPTARGVKRQDYAKGSAIPIVDQGQSVVAGYTDDGSLAVPRGEYVVFGDHTRAVKWIDFQFAPGADGTKVLRAVDGLLPKFAFYAMANLKIPSRGYNRHWTVVRDLRIPVPPFEVQEEVVRVLEEYSTLEAELETALQTELEARQHQRTSFWDALLTPGEGWRPTTIGEVATVFDGPHATPKKTDSGPWYLSISSLKGGRFDLAESAHLGEAEFPTWTRRVAPRPGDTMFSYETRLGQAAFWDRDEPAALGRRMGLLRPRETLVEPRFLTLIYLGPQFQRLIMEKTVHGSTVDRIPIADMASWEVSLPTVAEQRRIMGIIDKFEVMMDNLAATLSAEIDARRKQYEYYRDELLTFEEPAA